MTKETKNDARGCFTLVSPPHIDSLFFSICEKRPKPARSLARPTVIRAWQPKPFGKG
jgi:hypothetical protein